MSQSDLEPKKKRRQNVACDSCKLRRIKCDLLQLLLPNEDASSSSGPSSATPLHVLVRQKPDITCTHCRNKDIKCTTNQILNPTKPNKGGRRIDEARRKFGNDAKEGDSEDAGEVEQNFAAGRAPTGASNGSTPMSALIDGGSRQGAAGGSFDGGGFGQTSGLTPFLQPFEPDLFNFIDTSHLDAGTSALQDPAWDIYQDPNLQQHPPVDLDPNLLFGLNAVSTDTSTASLLDPTLQFLSGNLVQVPPLPAPQDHWPGSIPQISVLPPSTPSNLPIESPSTAAQTRPLSATPTPPSYARKSIAHVPHSIEEPADEATSIWNEYWRNPRAAAVDHDQPEPEPKSDSYPSQELPVFGRARDPVPSMDPRLVGSFDPGSSHLVKHSANVSRSAQADSDTRSSPQTPSPVAIMTNTSRKRPRSRSPLSNGVMTPQHLDTWKLWSEDNRIMQWSRREEVQEQLADRAIGIELSRHLVRVFFQAVHYSLPAISPESFYMEWRRAGERSDFMPPAQETLCAVIEAFGARYSDSPVVLGLPPERPETAPKVILPDGRFAPGTQARAHWGRARVDACNALAERARRLIDVNGILRRPTVTGVQALVLFTHLEYSSDKRHTAEADWLQNQMIHCTIAEQMKLLQLTWDSPGPIKMDPEELPMSLGEMRMKQRRLFWIMLVADAFWAAGTGQEPRIAERDVSVAGKWLLSMQDRLPMSTFKALAFFMMCYHRLSFVGRNVAIKLTGPNRRRGAVDAIQFCKDTRAIWSELEAVVADLNSHVGGLLKECDAILLGFSPLNYLANIRLSIPFLLLVVHQVIREQLDFRQDLAGTYIITDDTSPTSGANNVRMLEQLHMESVDLLLQSCRAQTRMFEKLQPTGIVQTASIFLRILIATAQFLAEVPCNEQGYPPNTPGGTGWTWAAKRREIGCCVDALYQLGWAWADANDVLESVMDSMERMQPTPEQLMAFHVTPPDIDQNVALKQQQAADMEDETLRTAMVFWPPPRVATLVEMTLAGKKIAWINSIDGTPKVSNDPAITQAKAASMGGHYQTSENVVGDINEGEWNGVYRGDNEPMINRARFAPNNVTSSSGLSTGRSSTTTPRTNKLVAVDPTAGETKFRAAAERESLISALSQDSTPVPSSSGSRSPFNVSAHGSTASSQPRGFVYDIIRDHIYSSSPDDATSTKRARVNIGSMYMGANGDGDNGHRPPSLHPLPTTDFVSPDSTHSQSSGTSGSTASDQPALAASGLWSFDLSDAMNAIPNAFTGPEGTTTEEFEKLLESIVASATPSGDS